MYVRITVCVCSIKTILFAKGLTLSLLMFTVVEEDGGGLAIAADWANNVNETWGP